MILFLSSIGLISLACDNSDKSNERGSSDSGDDDSTDDDDFNNAVDYYSLNNLPEDVWTDPDSGLMWQVWPKGDARFNYYTAIEHCDELVYGGYDDWRLPTISELRTLIRGCPGTHIEGSCSVTDSCTGPECRNDMCWGCDYLNGLAEGGIYWPNDFTVSEKYFYQYGFWSSTIYTETEYDQDRAWRIHFTDAGLMTIPKNSADTARCVR